MAAENMLTAADYDEPKSKTITKADHIDQINIWHIGFVY